MIMAQLAAKRHSGMTLVEQLVTLVLISVGLLGVAALQVSGLKTSKETYTRLRASALAADILDRMRANPLGCRNGAYAVTFNGTGTPGTTAGADLSTWQAEVDRVLPGGAARAAGAIECVEGTNAVKVILRWSESDIPEPPRQRLRTLELQTEM